MHPTTSISLPTRPLFVVAFAGVLSTACTDAPVALPDNVRAIAPVLSEAPPPGFGTYPGVGHGGNYMHNYYLPPAPSSTPWYPAWHPDGEAIAVSMGGSVWEVDVATGNAREVTRGGEYHSSPVWSPDGRWLVYTADEGGSRIQLHILDTESGSSQALTDDDYVYADPAFSPDGTRIAYVSSAPNGYFNVYIRPIADGQWAGDAIAVTQDNDYGANRLYFGPMDMHLSPAWLPSGEELLIVSNRDVPLGSGNVIRVPARAGGIAEATTVLSEQTLYRTQPDVSIDGRRFVYSSTAGAADQFNNLYVQPTTGGEPYKITLFRGHDVFHPRWSPDGEQIAYITNENGLPQLEIIDTYGGRRNRISIAERTHRDPVGTLSVTVRTDATGADPVTSRIILLGADGKYHAPPDAYARIGQRGRYPAFHTSGTFTVDLPPGTTDMTVVKGFEIEPQRFSIDIAPGETTEIDVTLHQFTDLSAEGWYNGSTHVHMNYAGNLHNTLENLMFMSEAEGQDIVNEQVANKDNRILDHQFFVPGGGAHPVSTADQLVVVGQEYRPPFYGHVFMLGLRDHLISPYTTGYEGTAIESLYPSNTDMMRLAQEQGAVTGYVHPYFGDADPLTTGLGGGKGFLVDAVLGTSDALEWSSAERAGFFPLYAAWSNDIRVCATGGEDSISNLHTTPLLGAMRTYIKTADGQLTAEGWYDGMRDARAFVTNGPLVEFAVNGEIAGSTLELPAGTTSVQAVADVRSVVPLTRAWIVRDGMDVVELTLSEDRRSAAWEGEIEIGDSGWMHFRAEGEAEERFPLDASYPQAFTNAVWYRVDGAPIRDADGARYGMAWVDSLRVQAVQWPGWRSQAEQDHVYAQFDEARARWEQLASEDSAESNDRQ